MWPPSLMSAGDDILDGVTRHKGLARICSDHTLGCIRILVRLVLTDRLVKNYLALVWRRNKPNFSHLHLEMSRTHALHLRIDQQGAVMALTLNCLIAVLVAAALRALDADAAQPGVRGPWGWRPRLWRAVGSCSTKALHRPWSRCWTPSPPHSLSWVSPPTMLGAWTRRRQNALRASQTAEKDHACAIRRGYGCRAPAA